MRTGSSGPDGFSVDRTGQMRCGESRAEGVVPPLSFEHVFDYCTSWISRTM